MSKTAITVRDYPAGTGASGVTVTFKLHDDDSTIDTDTTDAAGRAELVTNGSPGPFYWEADTGDVVRVGSTQSYGSGGAYSTYELVYALRVLGNGVIQDYGGELEVTYDAAGLDLDVASGGVVVQGIPAIFAAVTDHTVTSTRDATHPKACYLVVEVTGAGEAEEGKAEIVDVCGTAAASPALPSLTQTEALYQYPLATFTLPNTGSTTLDDVTDARTYIPTRNPVVSDIAQRTDPESETTTTSTTGATISGLELSTEIVLLADVIYDIEAIAQVTARISSAASQVQIAPFINGTGNVGTYIGSNATDDTLLANAHTLTVTGTGAAVSCGVRWKVTGGTATATTGFLLVSARPRS